MGPNLAQKRAKKGPNSKIRGQKKGQPFFPNLSAVTKSYDRQTILGYFAWPTKRPGGHQSQLTMGQSLYAYSAVTEAIRKGQTQL